MPSMIADAGPLLVLAKLNLLHLLKDLYGQVQITSAVYSEIVTEGIRLGYEDAYTLQRFFALEGWNPVETVDISPNVAALPLDRGELESIALALTHKGELLMDEERGRSIARQLGLPVRGTLGVLISAYRSDQISSEQLRFYFGQIAERSDIWISPALCKRLLNQELNTTES